MAQTLPGTGLPNIEPNAPGQSRPANELFALHDIAFGGLVVLDRNLTAPPVGPTDGDAYIVAAAATGDWAGQDDDIAIALNGSWIFVTPIRGKSAWIDDELIVAYWNGAAWATLVTP